MMPGEIKGLKNALSLPVSIAAGVKGVAAPYEGLIAPVRFGPKDCDKIVPS